MMQLFAPMSHMLVAAIVGFVFGFLLQKGRVARFDVIVGQLLLKDFTMLKVMLTAIIVGGIGVYALIGMSVGPGIMAGQFSLLGVALGAAILGVGMTVLGYCPGTAIAAAGQGARDALLGIAGMIVGVGVYAYVYPWFVNNVLARGVYPAGTTLVAISGINHWVIFVLLSGMALALFPLLTRLERRTQQ